jgi:surfeit locus 1 family protein
MNRRLLALIIPLCGAALFARLGFWQLSRLAERRAFNATLLKRLENPPVDLAGLPKDTSDAHYRRVTLHGAWDYDKEVLWAGRTRNGSPGVNFLTPLKIAGRDSVVIVNRGWAYSPDATTIDNSRWRDGDSATIAGYVETWRPERAVAANATPRVRTVHTLAHQAVSAFTGLPVTSFLVVQTSDSVAKPDSVPVRLAYPALDEGSHANYAIQWFSFAIISLVGGVALYRRSR